MFHKPFRVKTQTAIKGSDRKKLRAELSKHFNIDTALLTEIVPNKDEMTVMKIYTHSGETMVVYNILGNPMFFEADRVLYPTVYTLWKYPELLPVFTTWPPVFKKITGGADLMLPGVIVKGDVTPTTFGKLQKGEACAVKLLGNKAPVAVGVAALSGSDMYESAMRGKGVVIYHSYTDHLWAFGDKREPPIIDDPEMLEAVKSNEERESDNDGSNVEGTEGGSDQGEDKEEGDEEAGATAAVNNGVEETASDLDDLRLDDITGRGSGDGEDLDEEVEPEDPKDAQERMDDLLTWCCLCALKSRVKKSDLPLLTSTFYRNFLMPCCPAGKTVEIKKSSHKKLLSFLKEMQKRGFLMIKESKEHQGVDHITEIARDHQELRDFVVPEASITEQAAPSGAEADSGYVLPEIMEVFVITAGTSGFFKPMGYNKGSALAPAEIRKCVTDYVKGNELSQEKGLITLDAILSDLVLSKGEYTERLRWEELITRIIHKMSPACRMTFPGQAPVIKKGKLEPISLSIVQRGGNKKVTLIHGLETYGLQPVEFSHRVQIGMACSTSVSDRPGKNQGKEVLVQGNQINFIANLLLEKYKIPRKYISGLDKAPKGGKKR